MTIYISHSTTIDYKNDLYPLIRNSELNTRYEFILPHESGSEQYNTKELFASGICDLVIAECSAPSTGQGIELGWADSYKIPIVCICKKGKLSSSSIKVLTKNLFEYDDGGDLIVKISSYLDGVGL